ncbi:MAG: glycogen/starch synthase [Ferruginibacter sp.]|nr:glycogen/starch synthase [Ferruginibacter sp.]
MEILHVSFECYPVAKVGGLADVVGALPRYQQQLGHIAKVVMPMHRTKFLYEHEWEVVHKGSFKMGKRAIDFTIIKETNNSLGFDLYCVDIYGLLDREKVYNYDDDTDRFLAFQISVTEWLAQWHHHPDVIHVHDHHTALIPFMLQHCFGYCHLAQIPTILTIHNGEYQGWMSWQRGGEIPAWDTWNWGLLDWDDTINSLASGIKCAYRVNTVSSNYMTELMESSKGLQHLFQMEAAKCSGILNGIDYEVWNPETDTLILDNYSIKDVNQGKNLNKKKLCDDYGFETTKPLFIFIGRLVGEKAADLLAPAVSEALNLPNADFNFLVLGSGEKSTEAALDQLKDAHVGFCNAQFGYNEKLSHQMYAGADFILMPSRVEPCGLNQMYAMRYGTIPVVRKTGGLADTVIDYEDENGYGITFLQASVNDIAQAIHRSIILYRNKSKFLELRKLIMKLDWSWEKSAIKYIELYTK